jgi:secreted trypsin-like serine protease
MDYNVINNVIYAVFFAQEKVIKGVVSDSSGPIRVLMLSLKATKLVYKLTLTVSFNPSKKTGDVLVFLCRFEDKSVTVGSSTSLNVKLQAMAKSLDEVVVVAYGKQTAKSIVGSVYNRQRGIA